MARYWFYVDYIISYGTIGWVRRNCCRQQRNDRSGVQKHFPKGRSHMWPETGFLLPNLASFTQDVVETRFLSLGDRRQSGCILG
ncbi:MAG: hypothetical protein AB4352_23735 [Hormoscilla sp.]